MFSQIKALLFKKIQKLLIFDNLIIFKYNSVFIYCYIVIYAG